MSGKTKSWYLTVSEKNTHKDVFRKMFFSAPDLNSYIKNEEFKEKYPDAIYYIVKETY